MSLGVHAPPTLGPLAYGRSGRRRRGRATPALAPLPDRAPHGRAPAPVEFEGARPGLGARRAGASPVDAGVAGSRSSGSGPARRNLPGMSLKSAVRPETMPPAVVADGDGRIARSAS